jgi:hypothetical protein
VRIIGFGTAAAGLLVMTVSSAAQTPAAIVEDVTGSAPGVEFMDYVPQGKVIKLGSAGKLVLGYLKSCWRETISGGTVTIGAEQSDVQGGTAERAKVACEAARMQLTAELASKSGAGVFRRGQNAKVRPQFTLYGLSPLVEVKKGTTIVIERADQQSGERYEIVGDNVRGAFYDFAQDNKALQPSGIYSATAGKVQVLFQIDAQAAPGKAPMAGRLLRLQPAS